MGNILSYNLIGGMLNSSNDSLLLNKSLTKTTYSELKNLRDTEKLIPGKLYRITDYQCTTTQENTKSANHQFDIVLLALSENKLAEEGWAMEHPTDVYDITFSDGVTKKCYLYHRENSESYNLVDVKTLLGAEFLLDAGVEAGIVNVNHLDRTIVISPEIPITADFLNLKDLIYNYFQRSNLSAWKVWYSLDNDKEKFVWADDSFKVDSEYITIGKDTTVDGIALTTTDKFYRNPEEDSVISFMGNMPCYAWTSDKITLFTEVLVPDTTSQLRYGDDKGLADGGNSALLVGSYHAEYNYNAPNGRGVIYRLIDEWNNDVPYDFKNMMFEIPVIDGYYDDGGTLTYVYTFSAYDTEDSTYKDGSMLSGTLLYPDDVLASIVKNNTILGFDSLNKPVILLDVIDKNNDQPLYTTRCFIEASGMVYLNRCQDINIFYSNNVVLSEIESSTFYNCNRGTSNFTPGSKCVMITNKNVLVES